MKTKDIFRKKYWVSLDVNICVTSAVLLDEISTNIMSLGTLLHIQLHYHSTNNGEISRPDTKR